MDQEFKPGQIVSEPGVYRITHDPVHADMREVTAIKGRHLRQSHANQSTIATTAAPKVALTS